MIDTAKLVQDVLFYMEEPMTDRAEWTQEQAAELAKQVEAKRKDKKFMARVRASIERNKELLERLRRSGD